MPNVQYVHGLPGDSVELTHAKRRMATAILAQYEQVKALIDRGEDVGVFRLAFLPPSAAEAGRL